MFSTPPPPAAAPAALNITFQSFFRDFFTVIDKEPREIEDALYHWIRSAFLL